MKKKLLFTLLALFSVLLSPGLRAAHIDPEQGQVWWGYFIDENSYGDLGTGTQNPVSYSCCIRIPSDHEVAGGATIYAERLWLSREAHIENMRIWISKKIPATAESADIICDKVNVTKGGIVDFAFSQPYTMGEDSVYIGYSFDINTFECEDDMYPIVRSMGVDDIKFAMYIKDSEYGYWRSNMASLSGFGNLAMQVLLGDDFLSNAVSVAAVNNVTVLQGDYTGGLVTLKSHGGNMVESFDYSITVDGHETEPIHVDISSRPIAQIENEVKYSLAIPGSLEVGRSTAQLRITAVNDVPNEVTDGTEAATFQMITVAESSPRKTVMENYVKTTDNISPLSLVANDRLTQEAEGEYIGIMIHDLDPMATDLYWETCVTLPNPWIWANINRTGWTYQYYGSQYFNDYAVTKFGIADDFIAAQMETVEAAVEMEAEWDDDTYNLIHAEVFTTFQYDDDEANYALAFILTEDGQHGEGEAWMQANILYTTETAQTFYWDPEVWNKYVISRQQLIDDMYYNDVLVDGKGIYGGISGSISAPLECGEAQAYDFYMDITDNAFIQSRDSLEITAMLLDTQSGRIVNADRKHLPLTRPSAISTVHADAKAVPTAVYDIRGERLPAPRTGINVVRMSDGSIRKMGVR